MARIATPARAAGLVLLLAGCVRTPPSDGMANVAVDEVIRRLKCELITAIEEKSKEDPRFGFLTQWAAKIHLTLVVDDQSSINPGATLVEPLSVASTSRSLAIGGGLTTQAVRTEDLEFFISFPVMRSEMRKPFVWAQTYKYCSRDSGLLLESELGLKAVIDKALAPVGSGVLYTGVNNPGIGGGQPKIPANEVASIQQALKELADIGKLPRPVLTELELGGTAAGRKSQELGITIQQLDKQPNKNIGEITDLANQQQTIKNNLTKAKQLESNAKLLIDQVVTPLSAIADGSIASKCQGEVTADKFAATTSASIVAIKKYGVDNATDVTTSTRLLGEQQAATNETYKYSYNLLDRIRTCGPKEKPKPALYDPVDVISETVNFYVTATGSVTPSWRLVRVTAPLSSTFISGTRKDTNTLILAMGRPNTSGDAPAASKAMENQILQSILSQAVTSRN